MEEDNIIEVPLDKDEFRSGDFFTKVVVTSGYASPRVSEEGIAYVGVMPFLLEPAIFDNALKE